MSFELQKSVLKHIEPSVFPTTHSVPFYKMKKSEAQKKTNNWASKSPWLITRQTEDLRILTHVQCRAAVSQKML